MTATERLKQLGAWLSPWNPSGGKLGRVAGPILMMAAAASQVMPGTPFNLAGFSEFGGLDVSVYSGEVDRARWEQSGVAVAVVGAWHGGSANSYAESTLRNARVAGKITATYCYLSPSRDPIWQIDQCQAATGSEWGFLNFVAVDFETQGTTVRQVVIALERVKALGGRAIMYSGCWFVEGYLNSQDLNPLSPYPYWNAAYTVSGEFEGIQYRNCIPGARLMGEQYAGSGMWGAGQNIWSDKNVFDDVFIREGYPFSAAPDTPGGPPDPLPSTNQGVVLVQLAGSPDVYAVVGGGLRIHVCSPALFEASGYSWGAVMQVTADSPLWLLPSLSC